jgi:hypothetical protein
MTSGFSLLPVLKKRDILLRGYARHALNSGLSVRTLDDGVVNCSLALCSQIAGISRAQRRATRDNGTVFLLGKRSARRPAALPRCKNASHCAATAKEGEMTSWTRRRTYFSSVKKMTPRHGSSTSSSNYVRTYMRCECESKPGQAALLSGWPVVLSCLDRNNPQHDETLRCRSSFACPSDC